MTESRDLESIMKFLERAIYYSSEKDYLACELNLHHALGACKRLEKLFEEGFYIRKIDA